VEIFRKDFSDHHDSKREAKILSSSDFVTAAGMVQQITSGVSKDAASYVSTNASGLPVCLGSFILLIRPTVIIAPTN
jgi:hypothetical protein